MNSLGHLTFYDTREPRLKSPSNGTMQLPEYEGMSPASGGTAPGTLASERRLKMPSIARRPLLISTWRPRTLSLSSSNQLNGSKRLNMSSLRFPLMGG